MIQIARWFALGLAALSTTFSVHPAADTADTPAPAAARDGFRLPRTDFLGPFDLSRPELQAAAAEYQAERVAAAQGGPLKRTQPAAPAVGRSARPAAPAACDAACVQDLIRQAFAPYGQTGIDWGLRVAKCESGYNASAYNPVGPYYGVFQFLMSTFKATPYGNQNIFDATANVNAAAWKYGQGAAGAWGCK